MEAMPKPDLHMVGGLVVIASLAGALSEYPCCDGCRAEGCVMKG